MSTYFITCPCSGSGSFFVSWSRKVSNLSRFCVCAIPGQFDACNYNQDIIIWNKILLHNKPTETFLTYLFSSSQQFYLAPSKQYTSSTVFWQRTAPDCAVHYFHWQCIVGVHRNLNYIHVCGVGVVLKWWLYWITAHPNRNEIRT